MIYVINQLAEWVLAMSRPVKQFLVITVDICLCLLGVWMSFYLRMGEFVVFSNTTIVPVLITSAASMV